MYLPRDDWQRPVRSLMSRARLVVVVLDPTPGTLWEFVEATRLVRPQRLLLVVPADAKRYARFRHEADALLHRHAAQVRRRTGEVWTPPTLPDHGEPRELIANQKKMISGLIHFSAGWSPTFTPLVPFPLYNVLTVTIHHAARPALTQLTAYEQQLPADRFVQTRRRRTRWLRAVGHLTCWWAWVQALAHLAAKRLERSGKSRPAVHDGRVRRIVPGRAVLSENRPKIPQVCRTHTETTTKSRREVWPQLAPAAHSPLSGELTGTNIADPPVTYITTKLSATVW